MKVQDAMRQQLQSGIFAPGSMASGSAAMKIGPRNHGIKIMRGFVRWLSQWWGKQHPPAMDEIRADEIGAAVRVLYGTRHARRKRQRKRRHVTYRERDQIAWLLLRLQQERKEPQTMKRNEWLEQFKNHVSSMTTNLSPDMVDDVAEYAEQAAEDQEHLTGTQDPAMWQAPAAAAQEFMNTLSDEDRAQGAQPEKPAHPQGEPPGQAKPKPGEPGYQQPGQKPEETPPPKPNQDLPEGEPYPDQGLPNPQQRQSSR
jgi:hypothetical protein